MTHSLIFALIVQLLQLLCLENINTKSLQELIATAKYLTDVSLESVAFAVLICL